jgi:regulatory protein YycI of two-component signal transduction system YycFG
MDLAKAKIVVIILLLAFNIFLLVNNLTYQRGQGIQKETIESTIRILNARGITLECNIPTTAKAAHRLIYGNGKLNRNEIVSKLLGESYVEAGNVDEFSYADKRIIFSCPTEFVFTDGNPDLEVNVDTDPRAEKAARDYVKDKGLLSGKYVVDEVKRYQDGSVVVSFIEDYNGFLVYDNYCTVTVTAKGVMRLEYGKLHITGFSPYKVEDLAAAYQVLLANFREGNGQVITKIDIGYKYSDENSMEGSELSELLPVWRVKLKNVPKPKYLGTLDAVEVSSLLNVP